jgi:hypothetical protein
MKVPTPIPFMKRHNKLDSNPSDPSTNVLIKPKAITGRGTMRANGSKEARKRSSGYQVPFRLFRHLTTVRSEMTPAMVAPTKR